MFIVVTILYDGELKNSKIYQVTGNIQKNLFNLIEKEMKRMFHPSNCHMYNHEAIDRLTRTSNYKEVKEAYDQYYKVAFENLVVKISNVYYRYNSFKKDSTLSFVPVTVTDGYELVSFQIIKEGETIWIRK